MEPLRTIPAPAEVEDCPELTRLQYRLFDLLREYRGSVVRYDTIAARLWSDRRSGTPAQINVLARRVRAALGNRETIVAVPGRGLRLAHRLVHANVRRK